VLIGTPIEESKAYCTAQLFHALRSLEVPDNVSLKAVFVLNNQPSPVYHTIMEEECQRLAKAGLENWLVIDHGKRLPRENIDKALGIIREYALKLEVDYLWLVGADNPPPRTALKRLLALKTDIASALVYQRPRKGVSWGEKGLKTFPLIYEYAFPYPEDPKLVDMWKLGLLKLKWEQEKLPEEMKGKIIEADAVGTGCCLIRCEVVKEVPIKTGVINSEDTEFCHQARMRGYKIKVDLGLHCPHLIPPEDGGGYV